MFKKSIAIAMSLVLTLGLCPAFAFADAGGSSLSAGSVKTTAAAKAQSSKKAIWVRTSMKSQPNWPATTYKYNKKGLISSVSHWSWTNANASGRIKITTKYVYDSKGLLKKRGDYTFKYDKKGRLTEQTYSWGSVKNVTAFTNNGKGQATRVSEQYSTSGSTDANGHDYDYYNAYGLSYNSKGQLTKMKAFVTTYRDGSKWKSDELSGTTSYSYDKKGNVAKKKVGSQTTKFKNTYKSGRLAKRVVTGPRDTGTYSFGYKKLSVPVKFAKLAQQQQRELINPAATNILDWQYW